MVQEESAELALHFPADFSSGEFASALASHPSAPVGTEQDTVILESLTSMPSLLKLGTKITLQNLVIFL